MKQLNDHIIFIDFVAQENESGCKMSFWSFGNNSGFKVKYKTNV